MRSASGADACVVSVSGSSNSDMLLTRSLPRRFVAYQSRGDRDLERLDRRPHRHGDALVRAGDDLVWQPAALAAEQDDTCAAEIDVGHWRAAARYGREHPYPLTSGAVDGGRKRLPDRNRQTKGAAHRAAQRF